VTALWLLLRGVSPKVYGWIVVGLAVVAAFWAYTVHVRRAEDRKIAAVARADTTKAAIVKLDTAQATLQVAVQHANATRAATITTGRTRTQVRSQVTVVDSATVKIGGTTDTVPPAIVSLIAADDAKIKADSVHMAATDSLIPAIKATETAHAVVDTALTHQIGDDISGGHGTAVVVLLAVVGTLGALVALLHH